MKKIISASFFLTLVAILVISSSLSAGTQDFRGINVVSKQGKNLLIYKDYIALVIGISDYDFWPKLPYATKDAKN